MINLILENLISAGIGICLFILSWTANLVLSLYYNINILDGSFDKTVFLKGLYKMIALMLGIALIVVLVTTIPLYMAYIGMPISEEFEELITITVITGMIGYAILNYTSKAVLTLKDIFTSAGIDEEEVIEDEEESIDTEEG